MRERFSLFILLCVVSPGIWARGIEDLVSALANAEDYQAKGQFQVYLPSSQDPVSYDINLYSSATQADTLSPCAYLINWKLVDSPRPSEGFSAYFNGNFYSYRDKRLREYHFSASSSVFAPDGQPDKGVQRQTQFASLLPQVIAGDLREITTDSSYTYIIKETARGVELDGRGAGREFLYIFDPASLLPLQVNITNNPGAVSEQSVSWQVDETHAESAPVLYTEEDLMSRYPEIFENYRTDTFRTESLVGRELPGFSAPIAGSREHFTHRIGQPLKSLTLIAFINPEVASAKDIIRQIRSAAEQAPVATQILWAFPTTNRADEIFDITGQLGDEEIALSSARKFAAECGITVYPTLLIVNKDGVVKDVVIGANQDLSSVVIQKIAIKNL